jgi:DNA-binding winged helix-turn-helix (wHTH) protein
MNYQAASSFSSESLTHGGDIVKTTLRRLHDVLDPGNAALDLGSARAMVDSLIALTSANDDIPAPEAEDIYRSGRKHLILQALLRKAGDVCSKLELADLCRVSTNSTSVIKVYVCQIRAKLAEEGLVDVIETIWGIGYRIRLRDAREIRRLIRKHTHEPPAAQDKSRKEAAMPQPAEATA